MNTEEEWRPSIPGKLISANEVHVWLARLDINVHHYENLLGILSWDELARASRFRFERDQKRFVVARGILRKILGGYLEINPDKLRFAYTTHGKPSLAPDVGYDTLCFNLSHSDDFALYAVTRGQKIGIDIERVRYDVAVDQVAIKFLSPGEISTLEKAEENKLHEVFFQFWTRKEAFIKAIGEGLSFPMEQCDVSLLSGRHFSPLTLLNDKIGSSGWHIQDLFPGSGYAAAIAVEGDDWNLTRWHYSP